MMKTKIILLMVALFLVLTLQVNALELGSNYEKECGEGQCSVTVYSYQKYYLNDANQWTFLDESFGTSNCASGYGHCVDNNVYQFHVKDFGVSSDHTYYATNNEGFSMNLKNVSLDTLQSTSVEVNGNNAKYSEIAPGIDLDYYYTPSGVKEVFTLKNKPSDSISDVTFTFDVQHNDYDLTEGDDKLVISKDGNTIGAIHELIAYDSNDEETDLGFSFDSKTNTFTLVVDNSWLLDTSRVYPVFVDPTITFGEIAFDGYVAKCVGGICPAFGRTSTTKIKVGTEYITGPPNETLYDRGGFDWRIVGIPQDVDVIDINFTTYLGSSGSNLSFRHMDGDSFSHEDTTPGNGHFWEDMGNGTEYEFVLATDIFNQEFHSFNLTNASADLEDSLPSGNFSFGIVGTELSPLPVSSTLTRIFQSENSNALRRPILTITYEDFGFANETDGDDAIGQGIFNELPNSTVHAEQQVYIRLVNGTQEIGRFDRFASFEDQRWSFNYITSGESFTNMNNITTTYFVLEMINLAASTITTTVEDFITFTKN